MNKKKYSILFLGKKNDEYVKKALHFCRLNFSHVSSYLGDWGDPLPGRIRAWKGQYIISYLSRWVVPVSVLRRAEIASINFHPAPPDYPGIGCNNFALYDKAKVYGVTCHHMSARVDRGKIIAVSRFPILKSDDVKALLSKTYNHLFVLFRKTMNLIATGKELPETKENWTRKPFTRDQLQKLGRINASMSKEEITRRIRAVTYDKWKPTIELHGYVFELKITDGRGR